jgi:hypothetical protein
MVERRARCVKRETREVASWLSGLPNADDRVSLCTRYCSSVRRDISSVAEGISVISPSPACARRLEIRILRAVDVKGGSPAYGEAGMECRRTGAIGVH